MPRRPDPTKAARMARYRKRLRTERQLVEVRVTVPADRAEQIRDLARRLRDLKTS